MALTKTQVSSLYTALMGRASEGNGNTWWQTNYDDVTVAADAMLNSDAVKAYFGTAIDSDSDFVKHIYLNTLNKTTDGSGGTTADPDGINYWIGRLDGSTGTQVTRAKMIDTLVTTIENIQTTAPTAASQQWTNRVEVSNYTADTLATAPTDYKTSLVFENSGTTGLVVTDDATTVTSAKSSVDAEVPKTFTLTTGTDTFTGGAGDDTFNASLLTLNDGDVLDGGAGTDTLTAEINANVGQTANYDNIEVMNITSFGAHSFNMKAMSGITNFNSVNSTGKITINEAQDATMAIGFEGSSTNSIDLNHATGKLSGSADNLTVSLNTAKGVAIEVDAGFESASFAVTGTSDVDTFTSNGIKTITMTGSGDVDFANTTLDGISTFSATAYTGAMTTGTVSATTGYVGDDIVGSTDGASVLLGSGNDNIGFTSAEDAAGESNTVKLGAGNDKLLLNAAGSQATYVFGEAGDDSVSVDTSALTANDLIDLGAGTDTLRMNVGGANTLVLRGVENVDLTSTATGAITVNSADSALNVTANVNNSAVNLIDLTAGSTVKVQTETGAATTTAAAVSVDFKTAEATSTIDIESGMAGGALTLDMITNATVNLGAASDLGANDIVATSTLTDLTINATGAFDAQHITGNTVKNITVAGTDAVNIEDMTSTKLATVSVTGAKAVSVDDIKTSDNLSSVTLASTASTVDVSGAIGKTNGTTNLATVSITAAKAITETGGDILAKKIGTVTVKSSADAATVGDIGDANTTDIGDVTLTAAKAATTGTIGNAATTNVGNIAVTGGTTATVGAIKGKTVGNISVTGTEGAVSVDDVEIANTSAGVLGNVSVTATKGDMAIDKITSDKTMGTVTLTSTAGKIAMETGELIEAKDSTGLTVNMTAKTTIADADNSSLIVKNTGGNITASLAGAADATVDYTTATSGIVNLTASNTGGLDTTITNASTAGGGETSTITLGNAKTGTVNDVEIAGVVDTLNITGGTGNEQITFTTTANIDKGTIALGSGTADVLSFNNIENAALSANTEGVVINLSSSTITFDAGTAYESSIASGKVAEYDDAVDTDTNVKTTDLDLTISGVESVVGTKNADYIAANAAGSTIAGGKGADTIVLGAGEDDVAYSALLQGGTSQLTGGTAIAAGGDTISTFVTTKDDFVFNAASLAAGASASVAAVEAQNGWDLDENGIAIASFKLDFTAGTTTATAVSTAIGTINADAAQTGYIAIESNSTAGTWNIFEVTTSAGRAGAALTLNGSSDGIAHLAEVTVVGTTGAADDLVVGDFTFIA